MKQNKYFRITFCCSEAEQQAIQKTAKDCGISCSNYCKQVVMGHHPKYRLTPEDVALLQDVRKVKADLQRIANFFKYSNHQLAIIELRKVIDKLKNTLYDCNSTNN